MPWIARAVALIVALLPVVLSAALPQHRATPGGIAVIKLEARPGLRPEGRYQGRDVLIVEHEQRWHALIGIGIKAKLGTHQLDVAWSDGGNSRHRFTVEGYAYPEQRLTIENKRKVNPYQNDMDRISAERDLITQTRRLYSAGPVPTLPLQRPVAGRESSQFGLKRFLNNQARSPHSGLDIAAPTGTPILVPTAGKVVAAGDYFFTGNTVMLDHGHGLVSLYAHLSRIDVAVGQSLRTGQTLGAVGATGRVTGAHLHWSVALNGYWIDPKLLLQR